MTPIPVPIFVNDLPPKTMDDSPPSDQFIDAKEQGWEFLSVEGSDAPQASEMMNTQQQSGTLEFWADPAEDIYTEEDGDPV